MMSTANKAMETLQVLGWTVKPSLACATPLLEKPKGYVRVYVNSLAVKILSGSKEGWAWWSYDGVTPLEFHELDVGARLYWEVYHSWGWELDAGLPIEFDYEVDDGNPGSSV